MNFSNKKMWLISGEWGHAETFKMIPATLDSPYVECIYNPIIKVLVVIGKDKKDQFHMMHRLDDDGQPIAAKKATKEEPYKKQRTQLENYQEYYIIGNTEVEDFIKSFAVNYEEFDYKKYFNSIESSGSSISKPPVPQIIMP